MIIIRHKDARGLASLFSRPNERLYFANLIFCSERIEIIYFDNEIQIAYFYKEPTKVCKLIGELERNNTHFILLIDKKCHFFNSKLFLTVVNADGMDREVLNEFFTEHYNAKPIEKNKSKLFNILFKEFLRTNKISVLNKSDFNFFLNCADQVDLATEDLLFLAFSPMANEIFNSNKGLGRSYDSDRVWHFDENYDLPVKPINMQPTNYTVDEFCSIYEKSGTHAYSRIFDHFSENELTEIVSRFPKLFSDLVKFGYSKYDKEFYEEFNIKDVITDDEDADFEEYLDECYEAPSGTALCISCENFIIEHETDPIVLEGGKSARICRDCSCH